MPEAFSDSSQGSAHVHICSDSMMNLGFGDDRGQGLKGGIDTARSCLCMPLPVLSLMDVYSHWKVFRE